MTGKIKPEVIRAFCEAQGKGRARGRPRKVTLRSFIDYRLSIINILEPRAYTKFCCHRPPSGSLINLWIKPIMDQVRKVYVRGGV